MNRKRRAYRIIAGVVFVGVLGYALLSPGTQELGFLEAVVFAAFVSLLITMLFVIGFNAGERWPKRRRW